MHDIKDIVLKFMNKYKHPRAPAISGKDKENESVEVEKQKLSYLPKAKDIQVIHYLSLPTESSIEDQCKKESKPIIEMMFNSSMKLKRKLVHIVISSYH